MKTAPYLGIGTFPWAVRREWREGPWNDTACDVQPIDAPEWICAGGTKETWAGKSRYPAPAVIRRGS